MADAFIQIPPDSTGKKVDTEELTVGVNTVERQRGQIAGATATAIAAVTDAAPAAGAFALAGRVGDGHNVVEGLTTDAAVTTDVNATISGKLRGLIKVLASVWQGAGVGDLLRVGLLGTNGVAVTVSGGRISVNADLGVDVNVKDGAGNTITSQVRPGGRGLDVAVVAGSRSGAVPTNVTVGVASAEAVALNASRRGLLLRNISTSSQRISLAFAAAAVLDSGITLYPGDTFYMDAFDFTTDDIRAIASAASAKLAVQEYN